MARRHISQREARRLRQRVEALEQERASMRSRWGAEWPGGTHLWTANIDSHIAESIRTAQVLGFPCVVRVDADKRLRVYAVTLPGVK